MTPGSSRSSGPAAAGGRGSLRARRLIRRLLPVLLLAVTGAGCATKADVRDMRSDLARLQAREDSIFQLLQTQNREILDSLQVTTEQLLNVRGELANQLSQLNEQLQEVSQLTGQAQVRLNQLDQQLLNALRQVSESGGLPIPDDGQDDDDPGDPGDPPDGGGEGSFDEAREFYEIGVEQINRENAMSARRAFQMVVDSFPRSPEAPDAQRQIAETHAMEGSYDEAMAAFDRVVERWQDSEAAPLALYRAGVIAQERGNIDRARQYFRRVISGYPNSDARSLAEEALRRSGS